MSGTTRSNGRLSRTWSAGDPWATLLIVHGLAEHSGRYEAIGERLAEAGIAVRAFDLSGFGASEGPRGHVDDLDTYLVEIEEELEASRLPGIPAAMLGHSMGGLLAYRYALAPLPPPDALLLSSPAFGSTTPILKRKAAPVVAKIAPKLLIPNEIDGDQLSRDPAVGERYFNDPLVFTKTSANLGAVLFDAMDTSVSVGLPAPPMPTYVWHGGADTIVPAKCSAPLGDRPGVTRRLYPSLRHETMNEPEGPDVVDDAIAWLRDTVSG